MKNKITLLASIGGIVAPEELSIIDTLYQGASSTGNVVFPVPVDSAGSGTLAVKPSVFGNKVFVSVQ